MVVGNDILGWDEVLRFGTVAALVWSAAWFLFRGQQFTQELIYKKVDEIKGNFSEKIDYHERHDDDRFDNIEKQIISIRLQQAANTGRINGNSVRN